MKYILTLILGYLLPNVAAYINLDIVLGIAAGVLFGLLVAMLLVGPSERAQVTREEDQQNAQKPENSKRRKRREPYQIQHGIKVFNYPVAEWSAA